MSVRNQKSTRCLIHAGGNDYDAWEIKSQTAAQGRYCCSKEPPNLNIIQCTVEKSPVIACMRPARRYLATLGIRRCALAHLDGHPLRAPALNDIGVICFAQRPIGCHTAEIRK